MELEDSLFPLLREVNIGVEPMQVFRDADWALLIGAKPRGPGMERSDLLEINGQIFADQVSKKPVPNSTRNFRYGAPPSARHTLFVHTKAGTKKVAERLPELVNYDVTMEPREPPLKKSPNNSEKDGALLLHQSGRGKVCELPVRLLLAERRCPVMVIMVYSRSCPRTRCFDCHLF
jgi:hypothetical protein